MLLVVIEVGRLSMGCVVVFFVVVGCWVVVLFVLRFLFGFCVYVEELSVVVKKVSV